jgi:hypothetical protein
MNGTRIVISRSLGRHHAEASFGAIGVLASFSSFGLPSEDDRANTNRISRASGDDGQFGGQLHNSLSGKQVGRATLIDRPECASACNRQRQCDLTHTSALHSTPRTSTALMKAERPARGRTN